MRTLKYVHTLQDNVFILLVPEGMPEDRIKIVANTEHMYIDSCTDWRDEVIAFEDGYYTDFENLTIQYGNHLKPGFELKAFKQQCEVSAIIDVEDEYSDDQLLDAAEMGYLTFTAENNVEVIDEICATSDWLYPVVESPTQEAKVNFCSACGAKVLQNAAAFCAACGNKLSP